MDIFNLFLVVDELKKRISSVQVDEEKARRIASEILAEGKPEEALALLASIAARVLVKAAASWEHPCHCSPERVQSRISAMCAAITQLVASYAPSLAREACEERSRECQPAQTLYT